MDMIAILVVSNRKGQKNDHQAPSIQTLLGKVGYQVHIKQLSSFPAVNHKEKPSIIVLQLPLATTLDVIHQAIMPNQVPLLWCSDDCCSLSAADQSGVNLLDGILTPHLQPQEVRLIVQLAALHKAEKRQWQKEKQKLLTQLNERKWVETAKGILCRMKQISESEAYELLRKQAMNERKRIGDIAISIINVYQLLQENN